MASNSTTAKSCNGKGDTANLDSDFAPLRQQVHDDRGRQQGQRTLDDNGVLRGNRRGGRLQADDGPGHHELGGSESKNKTADDPQAINRQL